MNNVLPPVNQVDILAKHATEIRRLGQRAIADIIEIGARLTEAKRICGHGHWLSWLKREFGWTNKTAKRFMSIYALSAKFDNLSNLEIPVSALYLLAEPSTPEAARTEIIQRAQGGEVIPLSRVKHAINAAKARKQPVRRDYPARAWYREAKLGEDTIEKLRGTSLGTAREQDDLVRLNRGAPEGELKPEVEQLVADAAAGKAVSATARLNGVPPPRRDDLDLDLDSGDEAECLRARIGELERENRQLKFENFKLHREIEKLKARLTDGGDGLAIPDFLDRTRARP